MTIRKNAAGNTLTIALSGRLDTLTAPALDEEFKRYLVGFSHLILDFSELEYISSAGLRSLLAAQKQMNKQGSMRIRGVCPAVMEVLEITGFIDILTIE